MRQLPTCEKCGKKYISNEKYKEHVLNAHKETEKVEETVPSVSSVAEPITVHFSKYIEVTINSKLYAGKDMTFADYDIAGEVIRIAREAYGPEIMA